MTTERRAAIDIGTVTARLLVADVTDGSVDEVVRRQAITHLGEGWTGTGELSEAGIARVAAAVGAVRRRGSLARRVRIVAVATSAARDARNQRRVPRRASRRSVCGPRSSRALREGYLTFLGVTYGFCEDRVARGRRGRRLDRARPRALVRGSADGTVVNIEAVRSVDIGLAAGDRAVLALRPADGP